MCRRSLLPFERIHIAQLGVAHRPTPAARVPHSGATTLRVVPARLRALIWTRGYALGSYQTSATHH